MQHKVRILLASVLTLAVVGGGIFVAVRAANGGRSPAAAISDSAASHVISSRAASSAKASSRAASSAAAGAVAVSSMAAGTAYAGEETKDKAILIKASTADYNSLITRSYPLAQIGIVCSDVSDVTGTSEPSPMFHFNDPKSPAYFPPECVRITSAKTCYIVYKVKEGGVIYCYFRNDNSMVTLEQAVYSVKALYWADFSKLKAGDTFDAVKAIDPAAKALAAATPDLYPTHTDIRDFDPAHPDVAHMRTTYHTFHLLKDGALEIKYQKQANGVFKILSLNYQKSFCITDDISLIDTLHQYNDKLVRNFAILPQDYVH